MSQHGQHEMDYGGIGRDRAGSSYGDYEGTYGRTMGGEKLSIPAPVQRGSSAATQRLILAIVSLLLIIGMIFAMIVIMAFYYIVYPWIMVPLFLVLLLFAAVVVLINFAFNRR